MSHKRGNSGKTSPAPCGAAARPGASHASRGSVVFLLAQMLLCVVGINACFGWWSVKQERIIKKPYHVLVTSSASGSAADGTTHTEKQYLSTVYGITLSQTFAGFLISVALLGLNKLAQRLKERWTHAATAKCGDKQMQPQHQHSRTRLTTQDVPELLAMGFSNLFGSSLGYAAMRRLSYPVTLTAKMGKMLPVMLVGYVWYSTRYPLSKVVSCLLITCGVITFALLEHNANAPATAATTSAAGSAKSAASPSSPFGMALMIITLLMDGYTNSTQDVLVKRHRWGGVPLMMWTNLVSVVCAAFVLVNLEWGEQPWEWLWAFLEAVVAAVAREPRVAGSAAGQVVIPWVQHTVLRSPAAGAPATPSVLPFHDFSHFVQFLAHCPEARQDVLLMCVLNAVGQLFIFHTISLFGTLALSAMTLLRKAGSVLLSIYVHGHPVQGTQWAALGAVFVGVLSEGYSNIQDASRRQRAGSNSPTPPSTPSLKAGSSATKRAVGASAEESGVSNEVLSKQLPLETKAPSSPPATGPAAKGPVKNNASTTTSPPTATTSRRSRNATATVCKALQCLSGSVDDSSDAATHHRVSATSQGRVSIAHTSPNASASRAHSKKTR